MARAKKQLEENVEAELLPPDEIAPPQILVKKRLHQEWVEPMPQPQAAPEPEVVQVIEEDFEPPAPRIVKPEPEVDPIERLLAEIGGGNHAWSMTVYRLPNYERDGNASLKAKTILCGTQPFDEDYQETIQKLYARHDKPNFFLVTVRRDARVYAHLPVVAVEPLGEPHRSATQASEANNAISAVQPVDPFAEMEKALKLVERFRRMTPEPPPPHIATVPQSEVTLDSAIIKLASEDKELVSRAVNKFFGESNNNDAMPAWLSALLPMVAPLIAAFAQKLAQPAEQQPQAMPAQIAQQPQQPPPHFLKFRDVLGRIVYGIQNGYQADFIAEEIGMLCERDTQLAQLCEPLISAPVTTVQTQIRQVLPQTAQIVGTPEAAQWLAEMQKYFTEGEETAE